jgi:Glu-tRNA(Gln) amidotransferase subunit E-like FAD-binding protein
MYPDTDSPPSRVTAERVATLRSQLRPAPWERLARYDGWGVPEETTRFLIRRGGADGLDEVVARTGADGRTAAIILGQRWRALHRAGIPMERLGAAEWVQLFDLHTDGKLPRECIGAVATAMARNPGLAAAAAAETLGIAPLARAEWRPEVDRLSAGHEAAAAPTPELERHLTGVAVRKLRGRAPAKDVALAVRESLNPAATGRSTEGAVR